jgi:nucleolar protein 56
MKCYLVDSFIGFFAYDEDLKLISFKVFEGAEEASNQIFDLERTGRCPILDAFAEDLIKAGYNDFFFEDELEAKAMKEKFEIESKFLAPSEGGRALRKSIEDASESAGLKPSVARKMVKEVAESLVKRKVRLASEKRDRLVAEAVAALDEIDKNVNIGVSRVREWYGLHFPELDGIVPDHRQYMAIIEKFGTRDNVEEAAVNEIVQSDNKAKVLAEAAKDSMGADISDVDLRRIVALSEINLKMYEVRDDLERYIDDTMKDVAPNLRELVGSGLGGRLIAAAGSLENLAKKPASTVQVIGAEKALFRSLKTGARPPKHGIIFQHQEIHNAPRWQRGKIARALAGKLSIAARVDAFGGEFVAEALKENLNKRIADIQKKYSKPPIRERQTERLFSRDRRGPDRGRREKWSNKKWGRDRKWRR